MEGDEAQAPGVAQEDHASGHAHSGLRVVFVSHLAGFERPEALTHGGDGGGYRDGHRVGVPALFAQALALGGAHGELFVYGGFGCALGFACAVSFAHER